MTLTLLSYNNYYNRIVKRHEVLDDYYLDGATFSADIVGVNFNPNDGVATSQIVNADFSASVVPDYALLMDGPTIISRWYVIECVRTRGGQYNLNLLRDLIADYYNKVLSAPMFIEKAMLSRNDVRIFNNENMGFNQIKTSEELLKDGTGTPWIVGYIAEDTPITPVSVPASNFYINYEVSDLDQYPYYDYTSAKPYKHSYVDYCVKMYGQSTLTQVQLGWDANGNPKIPLSEVSSENTTYPFGGTNSTVKYGRWIAFGKNWPDAMTKVLEGVAGTDWQADSYSITGVQASPVDLSIENGKIIKVGSTYKRVVYHERVGELKRIITTTSERFGMTIDAILTATGEFDMANTNNNSGYNGAIEYKAKEIWFTYEDVLDINSYSLTIDSNRRTISKVPYDIFAIPAADVVVNGNAISGELGYDFAKRIIIGLSKEQLYDIQLLPYAPFEDLSLVGLEEGVDYVWAVDDNENKGSILFWLSTDSFSKTINKKITVPNDAVGFKVSNECDKYRIVSPTYNGDFEFSAAKNGGVSGFNVFCSYKPFNPFIKIAPIFNNLYGEEFRDGRGCICQGDFSLPQINDQWVSYQINNKNYLNSFNRQIQNMEVNNAIQREKETIEAWAGALSTAGAGAYLGGNLGGSGWGAVAGAAAGAAVFGTISGIAGAADIALNEKLRNEALDYTKDQFGYQLGNIKALPYTLANVGAQTIISKYFPMLEYYTATEIEKEALRNKIKYNGMTVMTIGTIEAFKQATPTYIKGQLIRLEGAEEEYHFVSALANELYKGVFI